LVALRVYSLLAFGWWEKAVFAQSGSWLQRADHGRSLSRGVGGDRALGGPWLGRLRSL